MDYLLLAIKLAENIKNDERVINFMLIPYQR